MPYHVPEHIKRKRLDRLMLLQQEISLKRNRLRIGNEEKLLVIGKENGYYIARSEKEAPDVDGIIYLSSDEAIAEGSFVKAVIDDADSYDLYATHMGGNRLNLPNKITIARIVLIPLCLLLLYFRLDILAGIVFIIACSTDFVDGYMAKTQSGNKLRQVCRPCSG